MSIDPQSLSKVNELKEEAQGVSPMFPTQAPIQEGLISI